MCQCLDQLKEDVDNAAKKKKRSLDNDGNEIPLEDDAISPPSTPPPPCPITQNFEFKVLHTIRCKECGEEVTKTEEFYDLSVDMPRMR